MKKSDCQSEMLAGLTFAIVFLSCAAQAQAGGEEIKAYKKAFPDARVKCATCHSVAMPKKGTAELNDYGQAAVVVNPQPTAETFKRLGMAEDFKK